MALSRRWIGGLVAFVLLQILLFGIYSSIHEGLANRTMPIDNVKRVIRTNSFYIAALLRNNEPIIRHLLLRLPQLISVLKPSHVYVSIIDSGSKDRSSLLLDKLREKLTKAGVAGQRVISRRDGRPDSADRIEWLAAARNEALEPLHDWVVDKGHGKIVFLNDIIWEVPDIVDLIFTNGTNYDMACGLDFYYRLYDIWVTRDIDGDPFTPSYPYARRPEDKNAIRNLQSFPVYSCWNGVAVMDTAPFMLDEDPVRFRASSTDECAMSECFHVCSDFRKHGFSNILLNPRVRVAYSVPFYDLHHLIMPWINPMLDYFSSEKYGPTGRYTPNLTVRKGPTETSCGLE